MNQAHDTDTNSASSSVLFALVLRYYKPNIMSNETDEEAECVSVAVSGSKDSRCQQAVTAFSYIRVNGFFLDTINSFLGV